MRILTKRQNEIYNFIKYFIEDNNYPPTLREIGVHFGINSTNGVMDHLVALEKKGYIIRDAIKSRAIRLTSLNEKQVIELELNSGLHNEALSIAIFRAKHNQTCITSEQLCLLANVAEAHLRMGAKGVTQ